MLLTAALVLAAAAGTGAGLLLAQPAPGRDGRTALRRSGRLPALGSAGAPTGRGGSCVRWRITIYLVRRDGRYVIGNPPAGYAAIDRAC